MAGSKQLVVGLFVGLLLVVDGIFRCAMGSIRSLFFGRRPQEQDHLISDQQVDATNQAVHHCFDGVLVWMKRGLHWLLCCARRTTD